MRQIAKGKTNTLVKTRYIGKTIIGDIILYRAKPGFADILPIQSSDKINILYDFTDPLQAQVTGCVRRQRHFITLGIGTIGVFIYFTVGDTDRTIKGKVLRKQILKIHLSTLQRNFINIGDHSQDTKATGEEIEKLAVFNLSMKDRRVNTQTIVQPLGFSAHLEGRGYFLIVFIAQILRLGAQMTKATFNQRGAAQIIKPTTAKADAVTGVN